MSEDDLTKEQIKEIAAALDRVVNDLPWGQSVFLKALGDKFGKIRDDFKQSVGVDDAAMHRQELEQDKYALKEGQVEVYVSVYNLQGTDLGEWSRIIGNLTAQSVSRPTYASAKAVRAMIRSKRRINNEGYVSIHLNKNDMMVVPEEKKTKDKLGNDLLVLKERVITYDKIRKFYHQSGIYEYKKGMLRKVGTMSFSEKS